MVQFNEDKQKRRLAEFKKNEEEELAAILSQKYGLEYIDLTRITINTDALRLIPELEARDHSLAVFDIVNKKIKVAVLSPKNDKTIESINNLVNAGYEPTLY